MSDRTKKWAGRVGAGLGVAILLALTGCYARAGTGAYYTAGSYPPPAQTVYYAPAQPQAQVQVQTQGAYYVEQPAQGTYYVEQQPAQPTYYVQPTPATVYVQPAPGPVYVQPMPGPVYVQPARHGHGWGHGRRGRPVVIQQGGGEPVRVEVRAAPAGTVNVR